MNVQSKRIWGEGVGALLWCFLTLFTDRIFFHYNWKTAQFFGYKLFFFLIALAVIHGMVTLVQNIVRRDSATIRWITWTLPYLALSLVVCLVMWPGCWTYDNLTLLTLAKNLEVHPWLHFLTGSVYILGMMFIPWPGGLVLLQNIVISGIVGFFISCAQELMEQRLKRPVCKAIYLLAYLPFLLPPVLLHNQHPFRPTWAAWVELLAVFLLVYWYLRGKKIPIKELLLFSLLGIVTTTWRSESIYYLVAFPLMLAILAGKKLLSCRVAAGCSAVVIAGIWLCNAYNEALAPGTAWRYQQTALYRQTAALVQDADPIEDAQALALIDQVFDVQVCRDMSAVHGEELRKAIARLDEGNLDEENWKSCLQGVVQLALKYPKSLLRERVGLFLNTVQQRKEDSAQQIVFYGCRVLYQLAPQDRDATKTEFLEHTEGAWPINQNLREKFIEFMLGERPFMHLNLKGTWWMMPAFALLSLATIILLIQRKWMLFVASTALWAKIPLIFMTAPDSYFMYYLSAFIAGYAVAAAAVLYCAFLYIKKRSVSAQPQRIQE